MRAQTETAEDSLLYERQVPVTLNLPNLTVASNPSNQLTERMHPSVTVELKMKNNLSTRSKILDIQLTDQDDPFFFFRLELGEEDFHNLKTEQNLLVDFFQFPSKLIELLEACIKHRNDETPKHVLFAVDLVNIRFIARLSSETCSRNVSLAINETNSFKQINHLRLQLISGNDLAIKNHLAQVTRELKQENASLTTKLTLLQENHAATQATLNSKIEKLCQQIERTKSEDSELLSKTILQHQEILSSQKEEFKSSLQSERLDFVKQRRELEVQHEEQIRQLTAKIATLTSSEEHLTHKQHDLMDSLASAKAKNESLDMMSGELKSQVETLSRDLSKAKFENELLSKENRGLSSKSDSTIRELRELTEKIGRISVENQGMHSQKDYYEDKIEDYKEQISALEDGVKKASDEITKGNDIIRKFQAELKSTKSKVKLKTSLSLQQEKLLDERAGVIENQQTEIHEMKQELSRIKEDLKQANQVIQDLNAKLTENNQKLTDGNNVIEWLHKQLNEQTLGRPYTTDYMKQQHNQPMLADENQTEGVHRDLKPQSGVGRDVFNTSIRRDSPGAQLRSKFGVSVMASSSRTPSRLPLKTNPDNLRGGTSKLKSNYF